MLKLIAYAAETIAGKTAEKLAGALGAPPAGQRAAQLAAEYITRKVITRLS